MEILRRTPWSRIRGQNSVDKEFLEIVGSGKPTGSQCSKGDNCSFRHDITKRAKTTQPNPSPSSSSRQNERKASRTRSPRGKSPSGRKFRLPCKDYLKGTCTLHSVKSGILQNASSTSPRVDANWEKSALMRSARWKNSLAKGLKKNGDISVVGMLKITRQNWVAYFRIRAAEVFIDFAEELKHTETNPMCKIHKSRRTSC